MQKLQQVNLTPKTTSGKHPEKKTKEKGREKECVIPEAASVEDKRSTAAASANATSIAQPTGEEEEAAATAAEQSKKGNRDELKSRKLCASLEEEENRREGRAGGEFLSDPSCKLERSL